MKKEEVIQEMYEVRLAYLKERELSKHTPRIIHNADKLEPQFVPSTKDLDMMGGKLLSPKKLKEQALEYAESHYKNLEEWRKMELEMRLASQHQQPRQKGLLSRVSDFIEKNITSLKKDRELAKPQHEKSQESKDQSQSKANAIREAIGQKYKKEKAQENEKSLTKEYNNRGEDDRFDR